MKILVTGAKGFVGRNLVENLKNLRDRKDMTRPAIQIEEIYEYGRDSDDADLKKYCETADFVFHLAGVNRPKDNSEFMEGNFGFSSVLLETLKNSDNTCPVMFASSVQATLTGRYKDSEYGKSKLAAEDLFFKYADETGAKVYIYRFPNLFGKWCRPNYNSAVATFCNNIASGLPVTVTDPAVELELLYIDDLIGGGMLDLLEGRVNFCSYEGAESVPDEKGSYCYVPATYKVTLGEIVHMLESFRSLPETLLIPEMPDNSFAKKLYATYVSYLPEGDTSFPLKQHTDERGSFTELFKTENCGQIGVNITKPGRTKGQHWHNSKCELFIVVSGHGFVRERKIGTDEVREFEVNGGRMEMVHMLPGYTHEIVNTSESDDLVTVMWANEIFDPEKPDTFHEKV